MQLANTPEAMAELLQAHGFTLNAIEAVEKEPAPTPAPVAQPVAEAAPEKPQRHSWVKLREHTYICKKCGAGRVNTQQGSEWFTTWHLPSGWSGRLARTPKCEIGPRTEAALRKHAALIAAGGIKEETK